MNYRNMTRMQALVVAVGTVVTATVAFAATVTAAALVGGFVGEHVWNWFVPLTFASAPHLSLGEAIGLNLVTGAFVARGGAGKGEKPGHVLAVGVGLPGYVLLMGWIVHSVIA